MEKFAFVTRHAPTQEQHQLAAAQNIELVPIGDLDAFQVIPDDIRAHGEFCGVIVVHPAMAIRLQSVYRVGVFENANRAPEGERPQFAAKRLWIYDHRGCFGIFGKSGEYARPSQNGLGFTTPASA